MRLSDYVSTLTGTLSDFSFSAGNTYPAIAMPWGMNFWTPQTGMMGDGWAYRYDHRVIRGFKQTHQPSPWINDYGQFAIMPVVGSKARHGADFPNFDEDNRASIFSHKSEVARPYYYSVYLADHDVLTEIAPTERAAIFRFTFPENEHSAVVVDAFDGASEVTVDGRTMTGYTTRNSGGVPDNFKNWFVVEFDKTPDYDNAWTMMEIGKPDVPHLGAKAVVGFKTRRGEVVHARVASSFISLEQAYQNLRELGDDTFDEVRDKAQARWDDVLGRFRVEGGTDDQRRTFYSCLYRSLLFPRKFYEITADGEPVHYSPYNGEVLPGYMYTDTGFWDTFRSLFPLLNLAYPSVNSEIQQGLVNAARESGFLPEWASPGHRDCMVGNNSASVVADAVLKGIPIPAEDLETLYRTMVAATDSVHPTVRSTGRLGHEYYNTLGYIPCDVGINESVARTLEYAYDDWCILKMAEKLGRPQEELDKWAARAMNYRNVFDPSTDLMRGRRADGSWSEPFNPYKWGGDFTEGNSWHYTWSVFHDPAGLAGQMGGRDRFAAMLDSVMVVPPVYDDSYYGFRIHEIAEMQVMNTGNYAHGNQPVQHMLYLYDWAGQPWKTQKWVREVMDRFYSATPDGYCGDEDNGQTSAWYVFSALGFYPVCPGSGEYALSSPLFPKVTVTLENGNLIEIAARDNAPGKPYVSSLKVNGRAVTRNFVTHDELTAGVRLNFAMSAEPATTRGTAPEDAPYSFSTNGVKE